MKKVILDKDGNLYLVEPDRVLYCPWQQGNDSMAYCGQHCALFHVEETGGHEKVWCGASGSDIGELVWGNGC